VAVFLPLPSPGGSSTRRRDELFDVILVSQDVPPFLDDALRACAETTLRRLEPGTAGEHLVTVRLDGRAEFSDSIVQVTELGTLAILCAVSFSLCGRESIFRSPLCIESPCGTAEVSCDGRHGHACTPPGFCHESALSWSKYSFFAAGDDLLRSKDMDANSYDSGDWFNQIDWGGQGTTGASGCRQRARIRATDRPRNPCLPI
jgi:hypothetical protein